MDWTAYTRLTVHDIGIPDLVLHGSGAQYGTLIVIENKLKADEGEDQTKRYSSAVTTERLFQRFRCSAAPVFVFLTLFPDQEPSAGHLWRKATYRDLMIGVDISKLPADKTATRLLADWLALVSDFYASEFISPDDVLLTRLRATTLLEGSYLYFKAFANRLHLPAGLALEDCFRSSRAGRRYFGAVFSKATWKSHPMVKSSSGEWHLTPSHHFNIHIEMQFNVLSGVLSLYVHYETNPYQPEHWFVRNLPLDEQRSYLSARERFARVLSSCIPSGVVIGGRFNQLAKAACDFSGVSTGAAAAEVERLVASIADSIDAALIELGGQ